MARACALAALLLAVATPALAGQRIAPVPDPLVKKECGECHMAFQPAFLPARSWTRIMDNLKDHFGEDVALPADKADAIRATLAANAGDTGGAGQARRFMRWVAPGGAPLRITENPAFLRKHHFPERVWRDPKVVTRSNCPACHRGAEQGWYDDD